MQCDLTGRRMPFERISKKPPVSLAEGRKENSRNLVGGRISQLALPPTRFWDKCRKVHTNRYRELLEPLKRSFLFHRIGKTTADEAGEGVFLRGVSSGPRRR